VSDINPIQQTTPANTAQVPVATEEPTAE
jgi:hypothetical protein